jgi:hypothetical protein
MHVEGDNLTMNLNVMMLMMSIMSIIIIINLRLSVSSWGGTRGQPCARHPKVRAWERSTIRTKLEGCLLEGLTSITSAD